MDAAEIARRHQAVIAPGYGAIAAEELVFVRDLIATHRPKHFCEIGMASGLSTGFIAQFMDANGGTDLVSVDADDRFFGDRRKPAGFLVPELYQGRNVAVDLRRSCLALDMAEFPGPFDMGFIDANHQHPWPTLDTMAIFPYMSAPKIVIHHDLRQFSKLSLSFLKGIGPKILYDQFPDSHKTCSQARKGNIFALNLTLKRKHFESYLIDALYLPWSLTAPLTPEMIQKTRQLIDSHYSPRLRTHFDICLAHYNGPDYYAAGSIKELGLRQLLRASLHRTKDRIKHYATRA